jgi:hypothetical protein
MTAAEIDARWAGPWHPEQAAERLSGVHAPWYVAAGWALDLFRGSQRRTHFDLEIAVPAGRFAEIRERFPEFEFDAVGSGRIWESATAEQLDGTHQTWMRDPGSDRYLLDVFREPHDGDMWICRRDETLRLPYDEIIQRTADGIPYLRPEMVLLFKAKACRPKDEGDFRALLSLLSDAQRHMLAGLLRRIHPGHAWLTAISS